MNYRYKSVYYSEDLQKVWRTNSTADIDEINYQYIGELTMSEFDFLLEILEDVFLNNDISLEDFEYFLAELRIFADRMKQIEK
tara:strand:- start:178 stop:426 length:249 start_codon:yes stop_codon:yes gene_type:complete